MELVLRNLDKHYGSFQALKQINFRFTPGLYGILGANGAGKSTMINLIIDSIPRDMKHTSDSGVFFSDEKLTGGKEMDIIKLGARYRAKVGYMPQQQGFYEEFSPKAFLKYMAEVKGVRKRVINGKTVSVANQIKELLRIVNLEQVADKKIGGFSGGMKQRVMLAQALLGDPDILILDEPTAGLDPKERVSIRNYISELSKDKIILYATHVVSDVECVAKEILILKEGQIIANGTPSELINSVRGKVFELICTYDNVKQLQERYRAGNLRQTDEGLVLRIVADTLPEESKAVESGLNLEDVYMYYFE